MASSISNSGAANRFITEAGEIPFWHIEIGAEECAAVAESMARKRFSLGPVVAAFEAQIAREIEVPYAVCTASGTAALLMSLAVHGIGPGDEVLVPTRTFIATAHAALLLGAKPVLVDCLPDQPTLDVEDAAAKITSRTRAIMPVHLNGRGADMTGVMALARKHGLVIVEDACQGLFSRHPLGYHGTIGNAGCFSFSMVKLIATGQGGAVVTRDKATYEKLRRFRDNGVADVVSHAYLGPGGNFKYTDIAASIGVVQIGRREKKVAHVNAIYRRYVEGLAGLPFVSVLPVAVSEGEVALWTEVTSPQRDRLMDHLAEQGIQTRKFVPCCHTAPHFATQGPFPNSERFGREGFNLPCGPDLALRMVDETIAALKARA
ncbi:MAG TPA: DegT/DnrJ/EryC1/StrS family aminotransferase [Stellaceae bacterium]|nr:DegT/DnrJ/EryC1/StrS family aminotransferase [Stellaceae bacterium]